MKWAWFHGVVVSTQDSESCDPSSNLGGTCVGVGECHQLFATVKLPLPPHRDVAEEVLEASKALIALRHDACDAKSDVNRRGLQSNVEGQKDAPAGNRTRAARVAGEHSTTEPPAHVSLHPHHPSSQHHTPSSHRRNRVATAGHASPRALACTPFLQHMCRSTPSHTSCMSAALATAAVTFPGMAVVML